MTDASLAPEKRIEVERKLISSFSPHAPIRHVDLFTGRIEQIRSVTDAIRTPGLHVVIYGERGVGKTSLANILSDLLEEVVAVSRVQCGQNETFDQVIRRSLRGLRYAAPTNRAGFAATPEFVPMNLEADLPSHEPASPDAVASVLAQLPEAPAIVLVIDEFDRLTAEECAPFSDLVKALADRGAAATVVMVGVAENINELVASHASVERNLRQVPMPRMSNVEVSQIISRGFEAAAFEPPSESVHMRIRSVAQGFPHYVHLLAQNAGRVAVDRGRTCVAEEDVIHGMVQAVEHADQSRRTAYFDAITATRKTNLWREVVLACALAEKDERGFFPSRAVQESLSKILKRPVIQQTVAFHLGKLIELNRGPLLERIGPERRYRYRFIDPLMPPYVQMKAMADRRGTALESPTLLQ